MLIRLESIWKTYDVGDAEVHALRDLSLDIERGEYVAIVGASGSGKSTLMNIVGCLDTPTRGTYLLDNVDVSQATPDFLAAVRNKQIGFVFQSFNLLSRYSVFHNVELPLIYSGLGVKQRERLVHEAIEMVGLRHRTNHKPNELSGGQRQRVAIARALVNKPSLIIADEPTGNLDSATGKEIMSIFDQLVDEGNTLILVTHDMNVAKRTKRQVVISDGAIQ